MNDQARHKRSAARKNAKLKAALPLFADQLPEATEESEYWHWRRNKGLAAERVGYIMGHRLLDDLRTLTIIRRTALEMIGEPAFSRLEEYCRRTYPSVSYWYSFWKKVLTGEPVYYGWAKVEDRKIGEPAARAMGTYQHKHMTQAEYYERFPYENAEPLDSGFEQDWLHTLEATR